MPAMTNILVKDDAATPVEYTFEPVTDNPNPQWRANVAGISLDGQPRISQTQEKLKSGSHKLTVKLEVPVMETLGASGSSAGYVAPPKVAHVTTALLTIFADKRATSSDIANTLKMMVGIVQGASATTATGVLTQATVGGGWAASVLPITKALIARILPN